MLGSVLRDLRSSWLQLAIVDSLYKLLAFLVLWPVVSLALRLFVELSGRDDLADDDIIAFLLSPIGWAACVVIGALWVAIVAIELAALMQVLARHDSGDGSIVAALRRTAGRTRGILKLAWEVVWRTLAAAAPFLAVGGLIYWWLLTEHDINFYLDTQPPAFWWAVASIGGVVLAMSLVLAMMAARWSYALPLLLFDAAHAGDAMRRSSEHTTRRRWRILAWLAAWLATDDACLRRGILAGGAGWRIPRAACYPDGG